MQQLDPNETAKYVAWDEYYNQLTRKIKYVKGRGTGPWGHKHEKHFEHIAKRCAQREMDIRTYVELAIDLLYGSDKRIIMPKDLESAELLDTVKQIIVSRYNIIDPAGYWVTQIRRLQDLLTKSPDVYPSAEAALIVPGTGFDAWFRVIYPRPFNADIFRVYGAAAYEELRECRSLRDFLNKEAPENMAELRQRVAGFGDG